MNSHSPLHRTASYDRPTTSLTPLSRKFPSQKSPLASTHKPFPFDLPSYLTIRKVVLPESRPNTRSPKAAVSPLRTQGDMLATSNVMKLIQQSHAAEETYGSLLGRRMAVRRRSVQRPATVLMNVSPEQPVRNKSEQLLHTRKLKRGLSWLCVSPKVKSEHLPVHYRRVLLRSRKASRRDASGLTVDAKGLESRWKARVHVSISRLEQRFEERNKRPDFEQTSSAGHYSALGKVDQYIECSLD